jgi:ribulose-phosphate 3-epimerase
MIKDCLEKISSLKKYFAGRRLDIPVEIDGGVNASTIADVAKAGADIIVAGSAIFESADYGRAIEHLKSSPG